MNKSMKLLHRIPVVMISLLMILSTAGCSSGTTGALPTMQGAVDIKPKEHKTAVAKTQTLDNYQSFNALVTYDDAEELYFTLDYYSLKGIYVKSGEHVEEGQLLAELDASDLEYQRQERELDLKRIQLIYDRVQNNTGLDESDRNTQLEMLTLDMESVNLDIAYLGSQISKTKLVAPFSGVITYVKSGVPGSTVLAYEKFMALWKKDSMKLVSDVLNPYSSEGSVDISGIVKGMEVELIYGSASTETIIPGTITQIINTDPGIENVATRIPNQPPPFQLYIKPEGPDVGKLSLDHKVVLRISKKELKDVVVIPEKALKGFGNDRTVKVMVGEKVINRRVTTGYMNKKENIVVITSGLRAGESVLLD